MSKSTVSFDSFLFPFLQKIILKRLEYISKLYIILSDSDPEYGIDKHFRRFQDLYYECF